MWIITQHGLSRFDGLYFKNFENIYNDSTSLPQNDPGLVIQAVGLTFGVAVAMFLLYNFKVIKATQRFKSILFTATAGIFVYYLITMVLGMFNINIPFMYDSSALGIGLSLFIVAIAALI